MRVHFAAQFVVDLPDDVTTPSLSKLGLDIPLKDIQVCNVETDEFIPSTVVEWDAETIDISSENED